MFHDSGTVGLKAKLLFDYKALKRVRAFALKLLQKPGIRSGFLFRANWRHDRAVLRLYCESRHCCRLS